jgi:prepilin-type processing-associated H-X9-DG protein
MIKKSFTLIELMLVITIVVILSSMLLPALKSARDNARAIQCLNNQKQYSLAIQIYSGDYSYLPIPYDDTISLSWWNCLLNNGYVKRTNMACPVQIAGRKLASNFVSSYALNYMINVKDGSGNYTKNSLRRQEQVKNPSAACVGTDGAVPTYSTVSEWYWWNVTVNWNGMPEHVHRNKANIAYFDGHSNTKRIIPIFEGANICNTSREASFFWFGKERPE